MVMVYPSQLWCFLVDNLLQNPEKILSISENKYGCRVIQLIIEQLCERSKVSKRNSEISFIFCQVNEIFKKIL